MSKSSIKKYLNQDVLTAARERIRHVISSFDDYVVSFSGGKDSLVTLELVDLIHKEMGKRGKVRVAFRDEEVIPEDVIDFVNEYRLSGRFDFRYYCIPLVSEKYILGKKYKYIQWDPDRKHIRPIPDYAITSDEILDQYTSDELMAKGLRGKVAIFTGVRASESLVRLASVKNKLIEPHIVNSGVGHIKLIRPLYDWEEDDIFKYIYENNLRYCQIYDKQMWNGESLRVSTPLHAESAKQLYKVKTRYPKFYDQMIDLFPDIELQARYFKQYDRDAIYKKYQYGWQGIIDYINDNISDEKNRKQALGLLNTCIKIRRNKIMKYPKSFGGYPMLYVFKAIVGGSYKRMLQPKPEASKKEIEYERHYRKSVDKKS